MNPIIDAEILRAKMETMELFRHAIHPNKKLLAQVTYLCIIYEFGAEGNDCGIPAMGKQEAEDTIYLFFECLWREATHKPPKAAYHLKTLSSKVLKMTNCNLDT